MDAAAATLVAVLPFGRGRPWGEPAARAVCRRRLRPPLPALARGEAAGPCRVPAGAARRVRARGPRRRRGVASGGGGGERGSSVCVEEVLYRQALCMGREAAVDELLGQYEASATLYTRAKLTLEQVSLVNCL